MAILRCTTALAWDTVAREAPLLAVEVVSESQTLVELALKAQQYRTAGVEAVWVIDYQTRSVEVWTAQGRTTLTDTQMLASPLLPDFSMDVRFLNLMASATWFQRRVHRELLQRLLPRV